MTFLAVIAVSVWTVSAFTVPQPLENFYVADYANVINSKDADAIRTVNKTSKPAMDRRSSWQRLTFWTARRSTTSPMTCLMAGRSAAPAIIMACCWSWRSAKKITIAFRVKAWKNAADFGHSGHPGFYAGTGVCGRQLQHRSIKNGSGSGAAIGKTAGTPVVNPSPSQGRRRRNAIFRPPCFRTVYDDSFNFLDDFCFCPRRCDFVCLYAAPPPLLWRSGVPSASAPLLWTTPAADGPLGTGAPSA